MENHLSTEVTNISNHGLWIMNRETEYFLYYSNFSWFREAPVSKILNVTEPIKYYLRILLVTPVSYFRNDPVYALVN